MITAMIDKVAITVNVFLSAGIILSLEELKMKKLFEGIKRWKNVTEN